MKNIIIPLDFTGASMNAFAYAYKLFGVDSNYTLVHVASSVYYHRNDQNPELTDTNLVLLERELTALTCALLNKDSLPENIRIKILYGRIVNDIVRWMGKDHSYDAMVLAAKDKQSLIGRWFGTTALNFIRQVDIPLYLIPSNAKFIPYDRVLVANNFDNTASSAIDFLSKWNMKFKAFLKFLHIQADSKESINFRAEEVLKELIEKNNPKFGFEIRTTSAKGISDGLLSAAYQDQADLLITFPEDHNFLYQLVFKSLSKELILKSKIPMLFIPYNIDKRENKPSVMYFSNLKEPKLYQS